MNGDTLIKMARDDETAIAAWHCMAGDLSLNIQLRQYIQGATWLI